jgi:SAM-dependent methyltransferase
MSRLQQLLDEGSPAALERGVKLLQGCRLADTDSAHMAKLLEIMAPAPETTWLEIGSGFGEAVRLMLELRPDLKFRLVNNNRYQLQHTPAELDATYGDMHALPFADASFDGAMFLTSICNADDLAQVLREAARVTRPGGTLFVFDYRRWRGNNQAAVALMEARFYTLVEFHQALLLNWERSRVWTALQDNDALWRLLVPDQAVRERLLYGLAPVIWKAVRPA